MDTFIGFNTINQFKKFRLTDEELVMRDFINALNIRRGEVPGLPEYGTTIWDLVFTNQTPETQQAMQTEIERVAAEDPRLLLQDLQFFPFKNGIRVEAAVQILPGTTTEILAIFFDLTASRAARTI